MAALAYALTSLQRWAFQHKGDLYEVVRADAQDSKGTPGNDTYVKRWANVPCYVQFTPNVDDPTQVGGEKRATIFTTDTIHFHQDQQVGNGWMFRNTTPGPLFGQVHSLLGAGQYKTGWAETVSFMAMQEEHPPASVTT